MRGTRTIDLLKGASITDSSVAPGDPEARFITNDVPGCPNGGLLSGTDKPDRLAGRDGEDEVRGLSDSDQLSGGLGSDIIYGGPGDDELQAGGYPPLEFTNDRSKNVLHGGPGRDFLAGEEGDDVIYGGEGDDEMLWGGGGEDVLYGGDGNDYLDDSEDGHRDKLYCGVGKDEYLADKIDYVDSSCGTAAPEGDRPATGTAREPVGSVPDYKVAEKRHGSMAHPNTKTEEWVRVTTQAQSEDDLKAIALDIAKQDNQEFVFMVYQHRPDGNVIATGAAFMSAEAYKDIKPHLGISRQIQQDIESKGFPYAYVYYGPTGTERGVG